MFADIHQVRTFSKEATKHKIHRALKMESRRVDDGSCLSCETLGICRVNPAGCKYYGRSVGRVQIPSRYQCSIRLDEGTGPIPSLILR